MRINHITVWVFWHFAWRTYSHKMLWIYVYILKTIMPVISAYTYTWNTRHAINLIFRSIRHAGFWSAPSDRFRMHPDIKYALHMRRATGLPRSLSETFRWIAAMMMMLVVFYRVTCSRIRTHVLQALCARFNLIFSEHNSRLRYTGFKTSRCDSHRIVDWCCCCGFSRDCLLTPLTVASSNAQCAIIMHDNAQRETRQAVLMYSGGIAASHVTSLRRRRRHSHY